MSYVRTALMALTMAAGITNAQIAFDRIGLPPGLEPQNPAFTDAYGVSDDGVVVGSMYVPNVGFRGFSWTSSGGLVQLNGVGENSGLFARAITADGSVIVGENTNPGVGFRKVGSSAVENLSFPQTGVYDQSALNDVSNDGTRAAGLLSRVEDATFRAALWSEGSGWQDLGVLTGDYESSANAISADGTVVAGYSVGSQFNAFRWTQAGGMQQLDNPFGIAADAAAIAMSMTSNVIAGQARASDGFSHAVAWLDNGTSVILNELAGYSESAGFAVSGDGSLIGGALFGDGVVDRAALWSLDGTVIDLQQFLVDNGIDMSGWNLTAVTEISQNGTYIVGRGYNPDGALESFRVTIPAPSTSLLVLGGVVALRRRRHITA